MPRPNILYIHSHDTGRYVQPYGYAIPTPNIQKLAEQGVTFRQAFCAGPTCSASRAALTTGQCPHSAGMLGLAHRGWALNDYKQHLVHTLRSAGYTSTLIGFQHVAPWDDAERIGYDQVIGPRAGAHASLGLPPAIDFIQSPPKEPFFLSVGVIETHRFGAHFDRSGPRGDGRYVRPPAPIPDTPETRADMASFIDAAAVWDRAVGAIMDTLGRQGLLDNTLIICTTDHGIAFPMMKCNLTDHGTGVMLIMRGPGGFDGGKVVDGMVSQIDIFPTLCELLDIPAPDWLQGVSMMPLMSGEADEVREEVHGEVTWHAQYEATRSVRTKRWKYIRRFANAPERFGINCDASPTKEHFLANGWERRHRDDEMLYDLFFDPNESVNLASDPAQSDALADMRARLDRWMKETDDPLLKGPVPAPQGHERKRT